MRHPVSVCADRALGWRRCVVAALAALGLFAPLSQLAAHGDLHERIVALTEEIQRKPKDAELFFKRAELHRLHGDFPAAERDYDTTATLAPGMEEVQLGRGQLMLAAGRLKDAAKCLDAFLRGRPADGFAWLIRARTGVKAGEIKTAIQAYDKALALLPRPEPDHYLEYARALLATGPKRTDAAIAVLDAGVMRLGPLVTLTLPAIEAEVARGNYEAAMKRTGQAMERSSRKEAWLERRGDILSTMGRTADAQEDFREALAALRRLPARARQSKSARELEQRLSAKLSGAAGKP